MNLFLAGSPVEIISALACIEELKPNNPVLFLDRNISPNRAAIEFLTAAASTRFPDLKVKSFTLDRKRCDWADGSHWTPWRRWVWIQRMRMMVDEAVLEAFGIPLDSLEQRVERIYLTCLHEYVRIMVEACSECPRVLFPHGFDHPRSQQIEQHPFLYQKRGLATAVSSIPRMRSITGYGEMVVTILNRILGRKATCVPYEGTDEVYTFRTAKPEISATLTHLSQLKPIFNWLSGISPWKEALDKARQTIPPGSVVLLLSEYNRERIWDENHHWGEAHLKLASSTLSHVDSQSLVIKAHPRSDGNAALKLYTFLEGQLPGVEIHLLPTELSTLPIEAISMGLDYKAACSLGSCSLPSDIGIDVAHYTSPRIAKFFDEGWIGVPFWAKYAEITRMLLAEGICQDVESSQLP